MTDDQTGSGHSSTERKGLSPSDIGHWDLGFGIWLPTDRWVRALLAPVFLFIGLWQLFLIRPQTISLLLFVLLYTVLEGAERRPWLLTLAPCLLALWANVHGAFPIGLVLIGCYLLAAF